MLQGQEDLNELNHAGLRILQHSSRRFNLSIFSVWRFKVFLIPKDQIWLDPQIMGLDEF